MKRRLLAGVLLGATGFFLLLGARITYGYLAHPEPDPGAASSADSHSFTQAGARNYASKRLKTRQGASAMDQKYEKVAEVGARTRDFTSDESALRRAIRAREGLVQMERRSGLDERRALHLAIGVPPAQFDGLLADLQGIGTASQLRVTKSDKTNEYRQLKARQAALNNSRASLKLLQTADGSIEERIRLQDRLLDLERDIQDLKVSLGEFDTENELNTVKFGLVEAGPAPVATARIPWWKRAKVAFEWTVPVYLRLLGIAALSVLLLLAGLVAVERLQRLSWPAG